MSSIRPEDVTFSIAFTAGVLSFLSPCVLPIVPGYISYMSGLSVDEVKKARGARFWTVLLNSLLFVLGFSVVFISLGAGASYIGGLLRSHRVWFERIAGVVIFVFGLHLTGIFPIKYLYMERRPNVSRSVSFASSFLMGLAFSLGWTPCIGPVLAAILVIAARSGHGVQMLAFYSLGLGLPFLFVGVAMGTFLSAFDRIKKHLGIVEKIAGILLLLLGVLIFFSKLQIIARHLTFLPNIG